MAVVISNSVVLGSAQSQPSGNLPIIGYKNILNVSNITATSEEPANPITSVTNPATAYTWIAASAATQTITINTAGQQVDYIGIARHNLNQVDLTVTIKYNGITVVSGVSISDAQAILFLQNDAVPDTIEIVIEGADEAPQIGVIYIGKSLRLERSIYVGHTPITYGRKRSTVNGISENGQYLGEIVKRQINMTSVSLSNLTPAWYRSQLDPFFKLTPRVPCFWAWRPETYPDEIGYAWIDGEPSVSNEQPNGMMSASWNFEGLA
tara:strand:+ start:10914 stop:11708 length:795 start_codon:yes stop_codon:yes gene_type:complete